MRSQNRLLLSVLIVALILTTSVVLGKDSGDDSVIDSGAEIHGHLHHQHGGTDGHLPASSKNVRLVGKMNINQDTPGRVADVGVHGNYAYLAAFWEGSCQKGGVYVFDISKPQAPKQINFIRTGNNSYVGEGVQVIHVDTPAYNGDLLIHNNEICGPSKTGAMGGISLVDVTNPKTHKYLSRGVGDFSPAGFNGASIAHTVHSAFAWDTGNKAYAVLVDNEEGPDVDIMDISDPRNPVMIREYNLNTEFAQIVQPQLGSANSWFHDVVVKQINGRYVMLISYWDGGYVQLDVTDPAKATYIADTDFANPDPEAAESGLTVLPEGNAHQAEFTRDNDYIVAADEDFNPYSVIASNTTDGTTFTALQGSDVPQIDADTSIEGQTRFVGRACPGDPAVPAGDGTQIAVVERGVCDFVVKQAAVEAAGGYVGIIVFNREGADGCSGLVFMTTSGALPAMFVDRETGFGLFGVEGQYNEAACLAGDGTAQAPIVEPLGDTVNASAVFDGWGYVHLYANGANKLVELDTYAIPEAHDPDFAAGYGDLSVHEVAMSQVDNNLAYFAYYSGGFRVVRIVEDELVEVGHFIDAGGNNFWGVQLWNHKGKEYVLASDRDYGLYIFEYTGP